MLNNLLIWNEDIILVWGFFLHIRESFPTYVGLDQKNRFFSLRFVNCRRYPHRSRVILVRRVLTVSHMLWLCPQCCGSPKRPSNVIGNQGWRTHSISPRYPRVQCPLSREGHISCNICCQKKIRFCWVFFKELQVES